MALVSLPIAASAATPRNRQRREQSQSADASREITARDPSQRGAGEHQILPAA